MCRPVLKPPKETSGCGVAEGKKEARRYRGPEGCFARRSSTARLGGTTLSIFLRTALHGTGHMIWYGPEVIAVNYDFQPERCGVLHLPIQDVTHHLYPLIPTTSQ